MKLLKKYLSIICIISLVALIICACGSKSESTSQKADDAGQTDAADIQTTVQNETPALADGVYLVDFTTDSSMFHVNESCDGKATLTVKDGAMTLHITLTSKNIVNLFPGTAEDAQKEGAEILQPTTDSVTYDDGYTEDVYGFDVPVPGLDQEFDLALLGKKGKWYDHKVCVSNPEAQ